MLWFVFILLMTVILRIICLFFVKRLLNAFVHFFIVLLVILILICRNLLFIFCIHVLFKTPPPMPLLLRCIFLLLWSCFLKFFKPWLLINKKVLILMKALIPYFYLFLSSLRNLYQFIFSSRKFIIFLIYLGPWPTWNYFCECNMRKLLR